MKFKPLLFIIVLIFTIITAQSINCQNIGKEGVYHVGPYKIIINKIVKIKMGNTDFPYIFYGFGFVEKDYEIVGTIKSCRDLQNGESILLMSSRQGRRGSETITITPLQLH